MACAVNPTNAHCSATSASCRPGWGVVAFTSATSPTALATERYTAPARLAYPRVAAGLLALLVAFQLAVHLDEWGWNAEASPKDMATVDGHLAEWEWFHPVDAVQVLAHPRTLPRVISSQNVYRFLT